MAKQSSIDQGLIIRASRSHSDTPHSVRIFWSNDWPVAGTSTWQHTTLTRNRHPYLRRDSNPYSQQASDRRSTLRPRDRWNRRVQCIQEGNTLSCFFWKSKGSTWQHTKNFCDYRLLLYSFVSSSQWDILLNNVSFSVLRWTHLSLPTHYLYSFNVTQLAVVFCYGQDHLH